jgi:hypothetical protein
MILMVGMTKLFLHPMIKNMAVDKLAFKKRLMDRQYNG